MYKDVHCRATDESRKLDSSSMVNNGELCAAAAAPAQRVRMGCPSRAMRSREQGDTIQFVARKNKPMGARDKKNPESSGNRESS